MDLSLASPVWWVSVLLASLLIGSLSPLLLDRLARRRLSEQVERAPAASAHQLTSLLAELRLRLWVCTLLCSAPVGIGVLLVSEIATSPQEAPWPVENADTSPQSRSSRSSESTCSRAHPSRRCATSTTFAPRFVLLIPRRTRREVM